jgi:signal transduction histidine kinase
MEMRLNDQENEARRRLVLAADDERRAIERELHDGLQQDLVALAVNLQHARQLVETDRAAARDLLDELRRDVHEAIEAARALAHRIHPPLLAEGGLAEALRRSAPHASVDVALGDTLPPELAGAAYFCCVETLEVVEARAIALRNEDAAVVFEITGDVSDPDMLAVRDRVEALGGRLRVEPGVVSGSLPLPR